MIEVSSLIALLCGDDTDPPVPHPALVKLIIDGLASKEGGRWSGSKFSLCDYLFDTDWIAPKTPEKYVDELGPRMWEAVEAGFELWRKADVPPVKSKTKSKKGDGP